MNLLSLNVLIISTTLTVGSGVYLFTKTKLSRRSLFLGIALSIVWVVLVDVVIVRTIFRGDLFPADLWLAPLPLVVCIYLTLINLRTHTKHVVLSSVCFVLSVLFIAVLANKSYGYYPTLASLVSHSRPSRNQDQVTIVRSNNVIGSGGLDQNIEKSFIPSTDTPSQGKVFDIAIPGSKSGFKTRNASIYLPPAALARPELKLPVVILMAGTPGGPQDWLNGGNLEKTTNDFAAKHKGLAPLLVLVDQNGSQMGDTECVDSPRGNAETYLTIDVPSYIKTHYNVIDQPQSWAIGGLSNGGTCGVMLALRHPDIYKNFLDFSGEARLQVGSRASTIKVLFGGSEDDYIKHDPVTILRNGKFVGTHGWYEYGRDDTKAIQKDAKDLYDLSKASGMDVSIEAIKGTHSFYVWSQSYHDSLPWLAQNIGLTSQL